MTQTIGGRMSEVSTARDRRSPLIAQALKFGAVGGVGFLVNLVVFNLLRTTVFDPALVRHGPIYATMIATVVAIGTNWIGNRYWAFSQQRSANTLREGIEFFTVSLLGMLIPLGCLWLSHYVLGFTSLLADNISNNVVGLVLGTLFRFALYRWWVFAPSRGSRRADTGVTVPTTSAAMSAPTDSGLAVDR